MRVFYYTGILFFYLCSVVGYASVPVASTSSSNTKGLSNWNLIVIARNAVTQSEQKQTSLKKNSPKTLSATTLDEKKIKH